MGWVMLVLLAILAALLCYTLINTMTFIEGAISFILISAIVGVAYGLTPVEEDKTQEVN